MTALNRLAGVMDTLRRFTDVMVECAGDVAPKFTCTEAEAVADVLRLVPDGDVAASHFLAHHAWADDEGDNHWDLRQAIGAADEGTVVGLPLIPDPAPLPGESDHDRFHRASLLPKPSGLCARCEAKVATDG